MVGRDQSGGQVGEIESQPKIRIIHMFAPEIINTDVANFRELVQRLTGKPPEKKTTRTTTTTAATTTTTTTTRRNIGYDDKQADIHCLGGVVYDEIGLQGGRGGFLADYFLDDIADLSSFAAVDHLHPLHQHQHLHHQFDDTLHSVSC